MEDQDIIDPGISDIICDDLETILKDINEKNWPEEVE